jgi:hypothetical protein
MTTTIGTKQIITKSSSHKGMGPPAMSNIPPMAPPTPTGVPAPFPYVCSSGTGDHTADKLNIDGGDTVTEDSDMDVDPPGNQPSQPAPIHDIVTMMVNQKVNV